MKIILINRDKSLMHYPAEVATIYSLYFAAEVSMYYTGMFENLHLWYSRDKWPVVVMIELYFGLYADQVTVSKESIYKDMEITRRLNNLKNKSLRELEIIHRFRSIRETMKNDVINYFEWFFKSFGLMNWVDLLNSDDAYCIRLDNFVDTDKIEDNIIELLLGIEKDGDNFLMLSGNTGDFMKEHALDTNPDTAGSCDFYSFPLFHVPYKLPTPEEEPLSKESMIYIRKHLQEKIKPVSGKMEAFKKAIRTQDFGEAAAVAALECYRDVQADAAMFQQEVDNDLNLQQMKNATVKCFDVEWRVGVMKIATIPDYFEKARIIEPYVNTVLKEKLSLQLDIEKSEVFFYCKLPRNINDELEAIKRNVKE